MPEFCRPVPPTGSTDRFPVSILEVRPEVRKRIPPDDFQADALRTSLLVVAGYHRQLLDGPVGIVPVTGAFLLASISFIAAIRRISAKVKRFIVFCVILNITAAILMHTTDVAD